MTTPILYLGDCLDVMKDIPDGSVDMVMCDPPYGTTACKWDSVKGLVKLRNRSHDWNEDASFEDGLLDRNCQKCNSFFLGGKDRNFCKVCHLNAKSGRIADQKEDV